MGDFDQPLFERQARVAYTPLHHGDVEDAVIQARIHRQGAGQGSDFARAGSVAKEAHGGAQVFFDGEEIVHAD